MSTSKAWRVYRDLAGRGYHIYDDGRREVCRINPVRAADEARLIAAAPVLLEACRAIRTSLSQEVIAKAWPFAGALWDQVDAAIRVATGEGDLGANAQEVGHDRTA